MRPPGGRSAGAERRSRRPRRVATVVLAGLVAACAGRSTREEAASVSPRTIEEVLAAHTDSLMALPGVVGTAIGLCDGVPCIRVFLADAHAAARREIPPRLEGYPVRVEVTGPIRPRGGPGAGG